MNSLDSRFLALGDCFAQKFSKPGTIRYVVTAATGLCLPIPEDSCSIVVKPGKERENKQHNVVVSFQGEAFIADPPHLEIATGDMVLWHTPDASAPGFAIGRPVFGSIPLVQFTNAKLLAESSCPLARSST